MKTEPSNLFFPSKKTNRAGISSSFHFSKIKVVKMRGKKNGSRE